MSVFSNACDGVKCTVRVRRRIDDDHPPSSVLKKNAADVRRLIDAAPDWGKAASAFDAMFRKMADPGGAAWSAARMESLRTVYYEARERDKACANITIRTVRAMPAAEANDTRLVLLEIANVCRIFNAAHKVHFDPEELPRDTGEIVMKPSSGGRLTFRDAMQSLYPKTSLTFDYWVPKILEWTREIRATRTKGWKDGAATRLESCTDFMRVCPEFVAEPSDNVPIAKAEHRETLIRLAGETFVWTKKSAKREDVEANSRALKTILLDAADTAGMSIPLEAWSRLQHAPYVAAILK
jgi:hypothetical protein